MLWAGLVITVMGIAAGIAYFSDVTESVWVSASNIASWYVAFMCGYVIYQSVPMFIAHGRTRRDTAIEAVIFLTSFAAAAALLITAGYLIEYGIYEIAGWPRDMPDDHLFTSHGDVLAIFWEYWLSYLVWAVSGGLVGAAFYRYQSNGWLALIPAAILVSLAGVNSGTQFMGFILRWLPSVETSSPLLFTSLAIASFVIGLVLTWPFIRDLPIHNR